MTLAPEQIDVMVAGPELDALVLVKVCGWRWVYKVHKERPEFIVHECVSPESYRYIGTHGNAWNEIPAPPDGATVVDNCKVAPVSSSWSDMRLVIDAMHKRPDWLTLTYQSAIFLDDVEKVGWMAYFRGAAEFACAEEAPLAVARAALKACMKLADGEKTGKTK